MMLGRLRTLVARCSAATGIERELDTELRFHLDMLTEQNVRAGHGARTTRAARRCARSAASTASRTTSATRGCRAVVETLVQDVRYGARSLRRNPGFAARSSSTMALGIGANTAIFSVVNGVLLRPLPYSDGDRLVVLHQQRPLAGDDDIGVLAQGDRRLPDQARACEGVVEYHNMWFILLGRAEPERVATGVVSANFFDVLGVQPLYGRTFVDGGRRAGRAGGAGAEPRVLAAQLRRRSDRSSAGSSR